MTLREVSQGGAVSQHCHGIPVPGLAEALDDAIGTAPVTVASL